MQTLPYFTADSPGIGGRIKQDVQDFLVEEVPLEAPSGRGRHLHFCVRKAGLPTMAAADRIAKFMGVRPGDVHVAGLKDAYAVTVQWMSIENGQAGRLERFRDGQIRIVQTANHHSPLRLGKLAGNRFVVRLRGVGVRQLPAARAVLEVLARRGVPNFFGEQRFGSRGDTGTLGEAMVRHDLGRFVRLFLGGASRYDPAEFRVARAAFDRGELGKALGLWPRHCYNQRKALAAYMRKRSAVSALAAIDKRLRGLYVSAYQSELFNEVLCRRLEGIDRVLPGDLAMPAAGGRFHVVKSLAAEQAKVDRFELDPTGPIFGHRSILAQGEPGRIERSVLDRHKLTLESFQNVGPLDAKGARRALRFAMGQPRLRADKDARGAYLELAFFAPSGCYATVVLREIMKADVPAEGGPE